MSDELDNWHYFAVKQAERCINMYLDPYSALQGQTHVVSEWNEWQWFFWE